MAGELGSQPYGLPVSSNFILPNAGAGATTLLTADQGGAGYVVPAGYSFRPLALLCSSNAALTAGTATFTVTDNTVAIANGPTGLLSSVAGSTLQNSGLQRMGASPIAAGHVVAVQVVTSAGYLPVTADLDVVLVGVLVEA